MNKFFFKNFLLIIAYTLKKKRKKKIKIKKKKKKKKTPINHDDDYFTVLKEMKSCNFETCYFN